MLTQENSCHALTSDTELIMERKGPKESNARKAAAREELKHVLKKRSASQGRESKAAESDESQAQADRSSVQSKKKLSSTQVRMLNSQEARSNSCANSSFNADLSSNINHNNTNIMNKNAKGVNYNTITNDSDSDRPISKGHR